MSTSYLCPYSPDRLSATTVSSPANPPACVMMSYGLTRVFVQVVQRAVRAVVARRRRGVVPRQQREVRPHQALRTPVRQRRHRRRQLQVLLLSHQQVSEGSSGDRRLDVPSCTRQTTLTPRSEPPQTDPGAEVRARVRGPQGRPPGVQQGQLRDHTGHPRTQGSRLLQGYGP